MSDEATPLQALNHKLKEAEAAEQEAENRIYAPLKAHADKLGEAHRAAQGVASDAYHSEELQGLRDAARELRQQVTDAKSAEVVAQVEAECEALKAMGENWTEPVRDRDTFARWVATQILPVAAHARWSGPQYRRIRCVVGKSMRKSPEGCYIFSTREGWRDSRHYYVFNPDGEPLFKIQAQTYNSPEATSDLLTAEHLDAAEPIRAHHRFTLAFLDGLADRIHEATTTQKVQA